MSDARPSAGPASEPAPPLARLLCHAVHPASMRGPGGLRRCGHFMGYIPAGVYTLLGTARHAPQEPDGDLWIRCTNPKCRTWHHYRKLGA